jgi:hypothetical protein
MEYAHCYEGKAKLSLYLPNYYTIKMYPLLD